MKSLKQNGVFQHSTLYIPVEVYKGEQVEVRKISEDQRLLVIERAYTHLLAGQRYQVWKFVDKKEVHKYV